MKILKSKKALSPVVASIILIAVTVAVSIAVAAWMGALTIGFMGSSSITITGVDFKVAPIPANNYINITLKNTGTKTVTIGQIKVNNVIKTSITGNVTLAPGDTGRVLGINSVGWVNGNPYKIDLFDSSGAAVGSTQQNSPGS
jgi:archaeal type IV pilus assembly protein PilA